MPESALRPRLPPVLAAFFRRSLLEASSHRFAQAAHLVGFAAIAAAFLFLARLVDAAPNPHLARYGGYAGFVLCGIALADLQRVTGSSLALRIREAQLQGTLEAMLATPTPIWMVLVGVALPDLVAVLGRSLGYLVVGALYLHLTLAHVSVVAAAGALGLSLAAFGALGLCGGALTLWLRRSDPLTPLVGAVSLIAGGVLYPTAVLPEWLRLVGALFPITPALDALRGALLAGDGVAAIAPQLAHLGLFAVTVGPVGAWLFAVVLRRARADGSLATY